MFLRLCLGAVCPLLLQCLNIIPNFKQTLHAYWENLNSIIPWIHGLAIIDSYIIIMINIRPVSKQWNFLFWIAVVDDVDIKSNSQKIIYSTGKSTRYYNCTTQQWPGLSDFKNWSSTAEPFYSSTLSSTWHHK